MLKTSIFKSSYKNIYCVGFLFSLILWRKGQRKAVGCVNEQTYFISFYSLIINAEVNYQTQEKLLHETVGSLTSFPVSLWNLSRNVCCLYCSQVSLWWLLSPFAAFRQQWAEPRAGPRFRAAATPALEPRNSYFVSSGSSPFFRLFIRAINFYWCMLKGKQSIMEELSAGRLLQLRCGLWVLSLQMCGAGVVGSLSEGRSLGRLERSGVGFAEPWVAYTWSSMLNVS